MNKLVLCGLLTLAAGLPSWAQQAPVKVKIKTKGGAVSEAAPAAAPVDWSRNYAALIRAEELRQNLTVIASDAF
ncbi:MAG: hypothetical protein JWR44_1069, partial [Hymenobacter sp.]|nr:hypothetical protein [Hymenobacter sp.]